MDENGFLSLLRVTGAFLSLGFLVMGVSAFLYSSRSEADVSNLGGTPRFIWERGFIIAAVILTIIGLLLLGDYLSGTDGKMMGQVGAYGYLIGGILIITSEAFRLSQGQLVYPLAVLYVVLAYLGQAAVGVAIVQSTVLPSAIGWVMIVWNLTWLTILPIISPKRSVFSCFAPCYAASHRDTIADERIGKFKPFHSGITE